MHRQRGSGRLTGCRKSNGFAAQQQTKAQFNQIRPRRSTGAYPEETGGPVLNPGSRLWVWIFSRVLCGRLVELGFKIYNQEEPTSCLHHGRSLQAEVKATGSSSGMVVLKVVWGISHSQLQLSCVWNPLYRALHSCFFVDGGVIFCYFLNGLMQPAQLCACLRELLTPLLSFLSFYRRACAGLPFCWWRAAEKTITPGGWLNSRCFIRTGRRNFHCQVLHPPGARVRSRLFPSRWCVGCCLLWPGSIIRMNSVLVWNEKLSLGSIHSCSCLP